MYVVVLAEFYNRQQRSTSPYIPILSKLLYEMCFVVLSDCRANEQVQCWLAVVGGLDFSTE